MDSTTKIIELASQNNGIVTAAMISSAGISRGSLKYLADTGRLDQVSRGVYTLPEVWEDEFVSIQERYKRGVFALESKNCRTMLISAMKFSAKHKKMRRKTTLIYSEAERKEIERVYGVFKDYIHASKFLDFVWSEKLGHLLLHIDPTKNTIEEDQIIASADELCAELFNEVATDVFQEAKREHFYPDADDDEIAEIRRRWQPYLDLLPEYRSSCRAFHTAE